MTNNPLPAVLASIKRYRLKENCGTNFAAIFEADDEGSVCFYCDVLATLPPLADGAVTVPREPTEEIIDSVRYMLTGIEMNSGRRTVGNFRTHCDHSGVDFSHWPTWATDGKHDDEHLTKAGLGILLYATFINAAAYTAPPADSAMVEALRECEEYFGQRADAEYTTDSPAPSPNEEMTLLAMIRTLLAGRKW